MPNPLGTSKPVLSSNLLFKCLTCKSQSWECVSLSLHLSLLLSEGLPHHEHADEKC
jgi:hypothetical protein